MITKIKEIKREHRRMGLYSVSLFLLGILSGAWLLIVNLEMAGVPLNVIAVHKPVVPQQLFYRLDNQGLVSEAIMENKLKQCDEEGNQQSINACAVHNAYSSRHAVELFLSGTSTLSYRDSLLEQMDRTANEYCTIVTQETKGGYMRQLLVYTCADKWNQYYLELLKAETRVDGELLFK